MNDKELYSKKDVEIVIEKAIQKVIKEEFNPAIERQYQLGHKHGFSFKVSTSFIIYRFIEL